MNTKKFVSPTLIVCIAAGAFAAGALFVEPDDNTIAAAAPAAAAPAAAAGGYTGSRAAGQTGASAAPATMTISDFEISPVRAAPGALVTVVNNDGTAHTVSARNGAFSTGDIASGATTTFVAPTDPGEYAVFCQIHPSMRSTLTVG